MITQTNANTMSIEQMFPESADIPTALKILDGCLNMGSVFPAKPGHAMHKARILETCQIMVKAGILVEDHSDDNDRLCFKMHPDILNAG